MKCRGSVTVFFVLLFTCLFSGIFALLEAARVCALKANTQMSTLQAGDGLLSSYSSPLWEQYRILSWEGDFPDLEEAESIQCGIVAGNRVQTESARQNFFVCPVNLTGVKVENYQLATDDGGAPFRKQAVRAAKQRAAGKTLQQLMGTLTAEDISRQEEDAAQMEKQALASLEDLEQKQKTDAEAEKTEGSQTKTTQGEETRDKTPRTEQPAPVQMKENPLVWMKKSKAKGLLGILMPEKDISEKKISVSDGVSRRKLRAGTLTENTKEGALDRFLFRFYLGEYYANAAGEPGDSALDYEMEYLIAGKSSDRANLRAAANRLLLLREAANYLYLRSDTEKQSIVYSAALAITGAFGHPELADSVQQAVLIAWAYAESVSDVRILLDGGKVSLIKTEDQWHTQLTRLSESLTETDGEKQQTGLSYENYLMILMWTISDRKLSYRAMDLIEKNTDVRMDEMIMRMNCQYEYEAPALFWDFVRLGNHAPSGYRFADRACLSYLPD